MTFRNSIGINPLVLYLIKQSPLNKLAILRFEENPVPFPTLVTLILSCNTNLHEIIFGKLMNYDNNLTYNFILEMISKYCPNLTILSTIIFPKDVIGLFA